MRVASSKVACRFRIPRGVCFTKRECFTAPRVSRAAYVVCCLAAGNPTGLESRRVRRRMIVGSMIVDGSRAYDSRMIVRAKKKRP